MPVAGQVSPVVLGLFRLAQRYADIRLTFLKDKYRPKALILKVANTKWE
jgi:hypothetical protein